MNRQQLKQYIASDECRYLLMGAAIIGLSIIKYWSHA